MDNFVLGALLQQANSGTMAREDDYFRQYMPRPRVRRAGILMGLAVAGLTLSVLGISVI